MQTSATRSFFGDPDADERFLEMVQDPSKRQERLKQLEQNRTMARWSLFIFMGLLLVQAVGAFASSNPSFFFFPLAMNFGLVIGAAIQQSAFDAKIKLIKLYILQTQNSDRAA